jgi:protein tyrosine/serine phosphatase
MDSIFPGSLSTRRGRLLAWIDSLFVDHAALRLFWSNRGVVVPGQVYRSNHPTPVRLSRARARLGLASVINLRGATRSGSDALSRERAGRLGLVLFDVPLSSGHAPSRTALLNLAAALRDAPRPVLIHCKSGADRAGFAAAVCLILDGAPTGTALAQLSLRHGHLRRSRAGILDAVLLTYRRDGEGRQDFLEWAATTYDPAVVTSAFTSRGLASFLHDRLLRRE